MSAIKNKTVKRVSLQKKTASHHSSSPSLVWTTDEALNVTSFKNGRGVLNSSSAKLNGRYLPDFLRVANEKAPVMVAHKRALAGRHVDLQMDWQSKSWRCVVMPLLDPSGTVAGCVGMGINIADINDDLPEMRELAAIVDSSDDAIISVSMGCVILSWNRGAEILLGYKSEEVIGKNISIIIPAQRFKTAVRTIRLAAEDMPAESYETIRKHKDGSTREVSIRVSPVKNRAGEVIRVAAILRDIKAQKQLEKTVLEISTDERRRIGHELHDGLGQHLTAIRFKSETLRDALHQAESPLAAEAGIIAELLKQAMITMRNLAMGLDPVDSDMNGLTAALKNLARETARQFKIHCSFQSSGEVPSLKPHINLALYRIAQESITNAVKHGRGRRIKISLRVTGSDLTLRTQDDGIGFVPEELKSTGMGLRIMAYRANIMGGVLTIDSRLGAGAVIKCSIPLAQEKGEAAK